MKILIDTSVWVECQEDNRFGEVLASVARKHEILGCPTVDEETEKAVAFLKEHHMAWEQLSAIHKLLKRDIDSSIADRARQIEREYLNEGIKLGLPLRGMKGDLSIVAFASIQNADAVISLNRKSMASDYARFVYLIVNSRHNLMTPAFVTERSIIEKLSEV